MLYRRKATREENLAGIATVLSGIIFISSLLFLSRYSPFNSILPSNKSTNPIHAVQPPINAQLVDARMLQKTVESIKKQQEMKVSAQAQRVEEAKAREIAAKKAAELMAKEAAIKAQAEKLALEKIAREKAAERIIQEKITQEKETKKASEKTKLAAKKTPAIEKAKKEETISKPISLDQLAREKMAQSSKNEQVAAREAVKVAAKAAIKKEAAETKIRQATKAQGSQDTKALKRAVKIKETHERNQALAAELLSHAEEAEYDEALRELDEYAKGVLRERMRRFWRLPPNLPSGLSVDLFIQTDRQGKVIKVMVDQSSGIPIFDNSAIDAVLNASPLPLPTLPKSLDIMINEGIIATFE